MAIDKHKIIVFMQGVFGKSLLRCLIILASLSMPFVVHAEQVTRNEARERAVKFLHNIGQQQSIYKKAITLTGHEESTPLYIFNIKKKAGYVIVSGDDRTIDILGYTSKGKFNESRLPVNQRVFLNNLAFQIESLTADNDSRSAGLVTRFKRQEELSPLKQGDIELVNQSDYSVEDWIHLIKSEIDHNRKVVYCCSDYPFFCDGYENNMFHIEWGNNEGGYYVLSPLTTDFKNIDPSIYKTHHAIIGISPTLMTYQNSNSASTDELFLGLMFGKYVKLIHNDARPLLSDNIRSESNKQKFYPENYHKGGVDYTDAIQQAINDASIANGVVMLTQDKYLVRGNIELKDNIMITSENHATIYTDSHETSGNSYKYIFGTSSYKKIIQNVTISNICIDQRKEKIIAKSYTNSVAMACIHVLRGKNIVIENNTIYCAGINAIRNDYGDNHSDEGGFIVRNNYLYASKKYSSYDQSLVFLFTENIEAYHNVLEDNVNTLYDSFGIMNGGVEIHGAPAKVYENQFKNIGCCVNITPYRGFYSAKNIQIFNNRADSCKIFVTFYPESQEGRTSELRDVFVFDNCLNVGLVSHIYNQEEKYKSRMTNIHFTDNIINRTNGGFSLIEGRHGLFNIGTRGQVDGYYIQRNLIYNLQMSLLMLVFTDNGCSVKNVSCSGNIINGIEKDFYKWSKNKSFIYIHEALECDNIEIINNVYDIELDYVRNPFLITDNRRKAHFEGVYN